MFFINNETINENTSSIFNEAYFGKTKSILAIEKQLDKFRRKYTRMVFNPTVNTDPDLIKLNRMFEKEFGFDTFCLEIENVPMANACTIPVSYRYDTKKNGKDLIISNDGYKFKPEFGYAGVVIVYSGIIFNDEFTTPEVMAIILHEIGHNFQAAISRKNGILCNVFTSIYTIEVIVYSMMQNASPMELLSNTNLFIKFNTKIVKIIQEDIPGFYNIITAISDIKGLFLGAIMQFSDLIDILTLGIANFSIFPNIIKNKISNPFSLLLLPLQYKNERIADNFATMYGYGAELSSAVIKFDTGMNDVGIMKAFNNIPVLSTIVHMNSLPVEILSTALDEHPEGISRAVDQLALLKHELDNKDLDPKMRTKILTDIKKCEKELEKIEKLKFSLDDPYAARNVYNKVLLGLGGKTWKEVVIDGKHKFDEYR